VRLTVPSGFVATTATEQIMNVVNGQTVTVAFGVQPQGTISGAVFEDRNGNTVQGTDEAGVAGVTLTLRQNGNVVQSTTTDANGYYQFTGVTPGTYRLSLATPVGYVLGTSGEAQITLPSGGATGADFALQMQGTLGGVLYHDRNDNRSQEESEPGIGGATVTLFNAGGPLTSMNTDSRGHYQFTSLTPGVYQVQAVAPDEWVAQSATTKSVNLGSGSATKMNFRYQSRAAIAGVVFRDLDGSGSQGLGESGIAGATVQLWQNGVLVTSTVSGADGSYQVSSLVPGSYTVALVPLTDFVAVTPAQQAVVLAADGAVNVGFGLQPVSTIAGVIYADRNGDGVRQGSENGISGATITLLTAGADGVFRTGDEVAVTSTNSAADGSYSFVNQAVGAYAVHLTTPTGYTSTSPSEVVVNLAQFWTAVANFGNQALNTVVASTFEDRNNNGVQDEDEEPLAGLTVFLEPAAQAQSALLTAVISATTNSAGLVTFHDIPAGNYVVRTAAPASGYVGSRTLAQITLAPNGVVGEQFGFQQIGTVAGVIFVDGDGNGRRDRGEMGLSGVTVTLTQRNQAAVAGMALATTVTASDGTYRFSGLPAGDFQLAITPPASYVATVFNMVNFTLSATGLDAALAVSVGFAPINTVSGRVFADLNKNGVQEQNELGVSGAAITLSGNGQPDRTVQTTVDGTFLLSGVPSGAYQATVTLPPNHTATTALAVSVMVDNSHATTARFGVRPNLPNQAPQLATLADIAFQRGQAVTIQATATDVDDVVLLFSAAGLPPGLAINSTTGLITGQLATEATGSYLITVTVTDPQGASIQHSFTLEVMSPTGEQPVPEPLFSERLYLPLVTR